MPGSDFLKNYGEDLGLPLLISGSLSRTFGIMALKNVSQEEVEIVSLSSFTDSGKEEQG